MALRTVAKYVRGNARVRFIPHCGDGTLPGATTALGGVFGGVGPFDFSGSGVTIGAVPMTVKLDAATAVTFSLNLTALAAHSSAILASEIVTAFNTSFTTTATASVDGTTSRLKIVTATGTYLQVYGLAAQLCGFGMGIGAQIVKGDTFESITVVPAKIDDQTVTVSDARKKETSVVISGYVKGATGVLTDTVVDYYMEQIFEGGVIDATGKYNWPISTTVKPIFLIEIFDQVYSKGQSFEQNLIGYKKITIKSAMGSVGDQNHSGDFRKPVYNYAANNYKDAAGVESSAVTSEDLTIAQFNALNFDNV